MDYNKFLFIPLGGVGGIGMNVTLYCFQGKWIIVDLGIGFADDYHMPGIDIVVADISFIKERRDDLLGIILTHGHEDHFGAIQYLWNDLLCPIYTTKFTAYLLHSKLIEFSLQDKVIVREVDIKEKLKLGPFTLEFINMTHSIPEMNAIAIHTENGSVLHTGDWKFDPYPVIGLPSDHNKLKKIGENGVLALVCDSTNVLVSGRSGSESILYDSILNIIKDCSGAVAIAMFSSNVARMHTIAKIAESLGRKIVILGKSLERVIWAAKESGYLNDIDDFLDGRYEHKLPREKLIFLCTGCQGERLAAAARLAYDKHRSAKLVDGDTIIFSSKIIPGNERRIYDMFNAFVSRGVKVITESVDNVHVSGHPSRDEISEMYSLIKPRFSIPVHGEYIHTYEHANLATSFGVEKAIIVNPGDVIDLNAGEKVDTVLHGCFGVDGTFLHDPKGNVMEMRRNLRDSGIVIITLVVDKDGELLKNPSVFAPGVLDSIKSKDLIIDISRKVRFAYKDLLKKISKNSGNAFYTKKSNSLNKSIVNIVYYILKNKVKGKPFIEVQIEQV